MKLPAQFNLIRQGLTGFSRLDYNLWSPAECEPTVVIAAPNKFNKASLTNLLCVVFRNGCPFVSHIVLPFLIRYFFCLSCGGHNMGPLSNIGYTGHPLIQMGQRSRNSLFSITV